MISAVEQAKVASGKAFRSLTEIRTAHLELLRLANHINSYRQETVSNEIEEKWSESGKRLPDAETIRTFLDKACRAGHFIQHESDRRAAQRMLDYWSAELQSRSGLTSADIRSVRLDSFKGALFPAEEKEVLSEDRGRSQANSASQLEAEASPPVGLGRSTTASVSPSEPLPTQAPSNASTAGGATDAAIEEERLRIRVAAQARQWNQTGYDGYLLRGEALVEATGLPRGPDIDPFIEASIKTEKASNALRDRNKNLLITLFAVLTAVLAIFAVVAYNKREIAVEYAALAEAKVEKNEELAAELRAALSKAEDERQKVQQLLERATQRAGDANKWSDELETANTNLSSATMIIARQLLLEHLSLDELGTNLRQAVLIELAGQVKSGALRAEELPLAVRVALSDLLGRVPEALPADLPGYQSDFVGAKIGMPVLTGPLTVDQETRTLNYLHYSLLMSGSRRVAVYAAVNYDRSSRAVLQTTGGKFELDRRLSASLQPDPRWYATKWVPAALAGTNDIAWGKEFEGDSAKAALNLSLYANVLPNSIPQSPDFNAGIWAQIENWVRNDHNPLANRVTIFTGPVFESGIQPIEGVPVPSAYWKVAVSEVPAAVKGKVSEPEFAVDAFLIPRDSKETNVVFLKYRISIAALEELTGLNFGDLIESTDSVKNPGPGGSVADDLAARVGLLDSTNESVRQSLRDDVLRVLSNSDLLLAERRKVIVAIVKMASAANITKLTAAGRLNILKALLAVPLDLWLRPDWLELYAEVRRAIADLDVGGDENNPLSGDALQAIGDLKQRLAFGPSAQTIYVQFAGMVREDAEALSGKLRALGWRIPPLGEERVKSAAGLNEVRYNPEKGVDRKAAELLAADLTAAGQPSKTRPLSIIVPNVLEIWVSK